MRFQVVPPPDVLAEVRHHALAPPHPIHHLHLPLPPMAELASHRRPHLRELLRTAHAHAFLQALGQLLLIDLLLIHAQGPLACRKACLGHHLVTPAQACGVARGGRVNFCV